VELCQVREWDSRAEFDEHLGRSDGSIRVDCDHQNSRRFYSLDLPGGTTIALCSAGLGIRPSFVRVRSASLLMIGADLGITCVDLHARAVSFRLQLGGPFYSFYDDGIDDGILVVHELGALRIDFDGRVRWSIDTEIVTNANYKNGRLVLEMTTEGPARVEVDVSTGAVCS